MIIRRPHPERSAFSLVEVLIAILVLSLGLLGLGAVFPTILRQQRLATQTTLGLTAQNASNPILASNPTFGPTGRGWDAMRRYAYDTQTNTGDWVPVEPEDGSIDITHLGSYILPPAIGDSGPDIYLPLSQRLYPLPYSTEVEPRFVWDIAVRLTGDPGSADYPYDSPLLVAVFLRPIDTGIKPPFIQGSPTNERFSLVAALLGSGSPPLRPRDRRNPVSVSGKGEPTFDGRRDRSARYALPIVADIKGPGSDPNVRDVCILYQLNANSTNTDLDVAVALFSVPGQRFIDRAGNLHTVTQVKTNRVGSNTTQVVYFSPEVSSEDADGNGVANLADVNPVIFLPTSTTIEPDIFVIKP